MLPSLDEDEREEIRLALALNGGTSLSVWMGGVAQELDRFRRRDSTYAALLDLVHSAARIDVIAGTSAGGLNGALLGLAIARNVPLSGLSQLWVAKGGLYELLRDPFESDPPSLLRGDEYFLPTLRDAFAKIAGAPAAAGEKHPLVVMITATALEAESRGFPDHFGSVIGDSDHRALFTFERDEDGGTDDFVDDHTVDRLALAARTSASFPGAFEASFIPVRTAEPGRPDMRGIANFRRSRWAIDGGVLVNTPVKPMLDAVLRMPAARQVRRVVAVVVPRGRDFGGVPQGDRRDAIPALLNVVVASLTGIPRQQSIGEELDRLTDYNREVGRRHERREDLLSHLGARGLRALAARVSDVYVRVRAADAVDSLLDAFFADVDARDAIAETPLAEPPEATRGAIERALRAAFSEPVPAPRPFLGLPPAATALTSADWPFGVSPLERWASVVTDILRTGLQVVPLEHSAAREELRRSRAEAYAAIADLRRLRLQEQAAVRAEWPAAAESATSDERLRTWAEGVRTAREAAAPRVALAAVAARLAEALTAGAKGLREGSPAGAGAETLLSAIDALAPSSDAADTARQLLALEVVERVVSTADRNPRQPIQLIQISADTPSVFTERSTAERKLTGVQLNHFGAFYKRSWRANDWLWGRLDGSTRLAQIIVTPRRLRQLGYSVDNARGALEQCVMTGDAAKDAVLREHWDELAITGELYYLDNPTIPVPESLPASVRAVSARLQLDILLEDLPPVSRAVSDDLALKTDDLVAARSWAARFPNGALGPREAVDLFGACEIADERIPTEIGSDYFTEVSTKALAGAANAVRGKHSGLPAKARALAAPVRSTSIATYLLARGAVSRHRTASIAVIAALALSAAILSVALVTGDNPFGGLAAVAAVVLIAGFAVAMIRSGARAALAVAALLLLGAVGSSVVCLWSHDGPWRGDLRGCLSWTSALVPLIPVAAVILAAMGFGFVRRGRWAAR